MNSCRRVLCLASIGVAAITSPSLAQTCDLFVAALAAMKADSSNTLLVDQTVIGVPQFAFNAYSSIPRGDTTLARVEPQLRTLNAQRRPVPPCLATERGWRTVPDSALFSIFRDRDGWTAFWQRYPGITQFALLSQPILAGDTATLFVAIARGKLDGQGVILRFVRGRDGRWAKHSEVQLWIS